MSGLLCSQKATRRHSFPLLASLHPILRPQPQRVHGPHDSCRRQSWGHRFDVLDPGLRDVASNLLCDLTHPELGFLLPGAGNS